MTAISGVDYSFARPAPGALAQAGVKFACRYLSSDGTSGYHNSKDLTAVEAAQLHAAGIAIVLNYESTANFMLGGYAAGLSTARNARAQATSVGAPPDIPIYYSADFDADATQVTAVLDFLHGAADAEGSHARVGVYGGYEVVKAAADAGFAHLWQTYAWSGGRWESRALIRQVAVEQKVADADVDLDEATAQAFGQWESSSPVEVPPGVPATVREGASGPLVMRLQRDLAMAGCWPGPADGAFGPRTHGALVEWQQAHLAQVQWADGVAGPRTWTALDEWVARVQTALLAAGFSPGPLDGVAGDLTEAAVCRFQTAKHLMVDGIVGPVTSAALHV